MRDFVTVNMDRATMARLRTIAGVTPLATWLRAFSKDPGAYTPPTKTEQSLAELIVEVRSLGQLVGLSRKRRRLLDLFLVKGTPKGLELIKQDLLAELARGRPLTLDEASQLTLCGLVNALSSEKRAELATMLEGIDKESLSGREESQP